MALAPPRLNDRDRRLGLALPAHVGKNPYRGVNALTSSKHATFALLLLCACPSSDEHDVDAGLISPDSDAGADSGDAGGTAQDVGSTSLRGEDDPITPQRCDDQGAPQPNPGEACGLQTGNDTLWLSGDVLRSDGTVLSNGSVIVENGEIRCVGCDCNDGDATRIHCPQASISPGLINAHEHIGFANGHPWRAQDDGVDSNLRWRHRHDWRRGKRGHPRVSPTGGRASRQAMAAAELRFVLGGATSLNGSGGADGFLRNLDRSNQREGLNQAAATYATFPLGDANGDQRNDGCGYVAVADSNSNAYQKLRENRGDSVYAPHVAEGIDSEARNEFLCLTNGRDGAADALDGAAIIHGVGLTADDFQTMFRLQMGLVWSPRSNISLYGDTASIGLALASGVPIALGTDWVDSGSISMLRELRCAENFDERYLGNRIGDYRLWRMATVDAARVFRVEDEIGDLKVGLKADIAIFAGPRNNPYGRVISAQPEDVLLVLRGGQRLSGRAEIISATTDNCDPVQVCGKAYRVCARQETDWSFDELASSLDYGIIHCGVPRDEPTCEPLRREEDRHGDSNAYTGRITEGDQDGDGIADADDNCSSLFNPIRPLDEGRQPDSDGDNLGDACDPCPFEPNVTECSGIRDRDGDSIKDEDDNCVSVANADQTDTDQDGHGDVCDECPEDANPGETRCPAPTTTIQAIQQGEVEEGTDVFISEAVVTALEPGRGFWIQQGTGAYSGVLIYSRETLPQGLERGQVVSVQGEIVEYHTLTELVSPIVTIHPQTGELPAPEILAAVDLADDAESAEQWEGVLVTVEDVAIVDANPDGPDDDYGQFAILDGLWVDDFIFPELEEGDLFPRAVGTRFESLTGIAHFSFGHRKILPRDADDVVVAP